MPELTFITTCRGRLSHLKQTLDTYVAQPGTDCIVVDYDCSEATADWVEKSFPQVRVVRVTNRPRFELSKARNLGAAAADTPWLCFVDADVALAPQFMAVVRSLLSPGHYFRPDPRPANLWGTCICHRDDFQLVEGYDEVLQGWGKEDGDFYMRLEMMGAKLGSFPGELLSAIPHDSAARVAHHDVKNHWLNATTNHVYCRAKWDLMRLWQLNLTREMRAKLYEQFRTAILGAHADGEPLEMGIPVYRENTWSCGPLEARLVYRLPQPRGDLPPSGEPIASAPS